MKSNKFINPLFLSDSYKHSHFHATPEHTTKMYSHFTLRDNERFLKDFSNHDGKVVVFGIKYFLKQLEYVWNEGFFKRDWEEVVQESLKILNPHIGTTIQDMKKFEDLHKLGYLPLHIKSIEEGELLNVGVPLLTITNTDDRFYWLTNFIESFILNTLYPALNAATITREFAKARDAHFDLTVSDQSGKGFHLHNFSFRGCRGIEDASVIGMTHNLFTQGTDTISGIAYAQEYYEAKEPVAYSICATEHSVVTLGINYYNSEDKAEGEYLNLKDLITNKYPTGLLAYIADSYDYFRLISEILPRLKDEIMTRDGCLIIRGDSGSAIHNICGYTEDEIGTYPNGKFYSIETGEDLTETQIKGTVETLWNIFGGTVNDKGFKELDSHIGLVYGDGLNYNRVLEIYSRLMDKGFAVNNFCNASGAYVLSVINTRDTFSAAIKCSYAIVDGKSISVYKEPKTDMSKKSVKGLLKVVKNKDGDYHVIDNVSEEEEQQSELKTVFKNGIIYSNAQYENIKQKLNNC